MQNSSDIENGNRQIREERIQLPYRRIFRVIAITLIFQVIVTFVAAKYLGQSSSDQLFNIGTVVALIVFLCGSFMWGQFPNSQEVSIDPMHADYRPQHMREMSITSKAQGALLTISGALYVLACFGMNWVDRIR